MYPSLSLTIPRETMSNIISVRILEFDQYCFSKKSNEKKGLIRKI